MGYRIKLLGIALVLLASLPACRQKSKSNGAKPAVSNEDKFVIDESFQPIVDEELYIFRALYPAFKPQVSYAPENIALTLFLDDSVRVAVLSRDLTVDEYKLLHDRHSATKISRFAIDAVTLIVNKASTDTNFTVSEIKKMLNGNTKQDKNIVFDNPNSGLVRYLKDFSGNQQLKQKNIYALKSNKDVIRYVSTHPDAIGITGFSWLNDPDKDYADAVDKVKIVGIKDDVTKGAEPNYFTPSQNTLALKQYPLTRDLFILNKTSKLGMEFAAFLGNETGQRIILRSGLLPDSIPTREINIIKKLKVKADQ